MSALLKLGWYFRLEWRRYVIALLALITIAGLVMIPPWITGRIVDAAAQRTLTRAALLTQVGLLAVIAAGVYGLRNLWRRQLYGASYRFAALLRLRIYNHLTLMTATFFQKYRTGDLMARATNDVTAVEMTAGEGVLALVDGALTGLIVLAIMVIGLSWKLTLVALLPWPIMGYLMWHFGNELHEAFTTAQTKFSLLNDQVQESLTGIRVIKAYGRQEHAVAAFCGVAEQTNRANLSVSRIDAKYEPTIHLTVGTSFLLTVAGGAYEIHQGELTVGALTSFTMYLGYLIWPMFAFGWMLNILERGNAASKRIEQLLAVSPTVSDQGMKEIPTWATLACRIERYVYPDTPQPVLHNIDFRIEAGTTFAIVGPTGSGKTTLLNLLLRLYEGSGVMVTINGLPITQYRLSEVRHLFGVVPQDPFLFSATIAENIALGRPYASDQEIRDAARSACVDEDISMFPERYRTMVGERGITLSGGQKQRIALARALLLNPTVLMLDDALSAVDIRTEGQILEQLRRDRLGRTTVVVAHRLTAVTHADQIVVLRQGTVTEQGHHKDLLEQNGWYARMFRYQQIEQSFTTGDMHD